MTDLKTKPKMNSESQKELDRVEKQFEQFDNQVKEMTMDRMNMAPKLEVEQQTKISQADRDRMKDIYLKPEKAISCRDKFNEDYRKQYEYDKEYVQFEAENHEVIGESIEIWTRPYGGMPAEFWKVPVNKPVWGPRYLAEQIKRKYYHRLKMDERKIISADGDGSYYGQMVAETTVSRLDARPVSTKRSFFMGAKTF